LFFGVDSYSLSFSDSAFVIHKTTVTKEHRFMKSILQKWGDTMTTTSVEIRIIV